MMMGKNLALITTRQVKGEEFAHVHATNEISEVICLSPKTSNNGFAFPLYLYPPKATKETTASMETNRRPNLSPQFLTALCEALDLPPEGEHGLPQGVSPEAIFHYAYAVFHAPTYRALYGEFLKSDFPRLPLTSDRDLFFDLATLGGQLVALHLLDVQAAPQLEAPPHPFEGSGSGIIERAKVKWQPTTRRVSINAHQGFEEVSEEVWEARIGGYQVAEKWLKDRDGRPLSFEEQTHYRRVLLALAETARLMAQIDARIPAWPLV